MFVNGIPSHRLTDGWEAHCCSTCHGGTTANGSSSVFINNLEAARIGDPVSCGSVIAQGSPNVFIGG